MTSQEQAARAIEAARAIAAMTPQQKAARVIGAIQMGDPPERPLSPIMRAVMAESIRAAVELVLYEHPLSTDFRNDLRAQFLAIADNIEATIIPENPTPGDPK
jgi:hypothetical protein